MLYDMRLLTGSCVQIHEAAHNFTRKFFGTPSHLLLACAASVGLARQPAARSHNVIVQQGSDFSQSYRPCCAGKHPKNTGTPCSTDLVRQS